MLLNKHDSALHFGNLQVFKTIVINKHARGKKLRIVGMREAVKKRLVRIWQKALWADESRICLYHTDGRAPVRRLPGERLIGPFLQGTVAGGGGVGCVLFRPHS